MSLEYLKENISSLSLTNRFTLVHLIVQSLKSDLQYQRQLVKITENSGSKITIDTMLEYIYTEQITLMRGMGGLLSTSQPTPTDQMVEGMLQKRQLEKFSQ